MRIAHAQWPVIALTAIVAVLATLLAVDLVRPTRGLAFGQATEGVSADYVIGILGELDNDRRPLFLVDTKAQTIMVYEYIDSQRLLLFRLARSYSGDREVRDQVFYRQGMTYEGPTVEDIQNYLRERRSRR